MKLHANAALSLKGRRELCRHVVERERTLTQAAEAAELSIRWARKWIGRYRAEGEGVVVPARVEGGLVADAGGRGRRHQRAHGRRVGPPLPCGGRARVGGSFLGAGACVGSHR